MLAPYLLTWPLFGGTVLYANAERFFLNGATDLSDPVGGEGLSITDKMKEALGDRIAEQVERNLGDRPSIIERVTEAWKDHDFSWFEAKEDLVFSEATKSEPDVSKLDKMRKLLELRTEFVCKEVLQVEEPQCLFNDEKKAICVYFDPSKPSCCAMALGSVTMLSDLDFTVMCNTNDQSEGGQDVAVMEVDAAEALTRNAKTASGQYPGRLLDTNFYANALAYDKQIRPECPCTTDTHSGVAMALYAVARGFAAVGKRTLDVCPSSKLKGKVQSMFSFGGVEVQNFGGREVEHWFSLLTSFLQQRSAEFQDVSQSIFERFASVEEIKQALGEMSEASLKDDDKRTEKYYQLTRQGLLDPSKFCLLAPIGLIFANEAYWVEGAISDVVFRKKDLSPLQVTQSICMNLGYALEHVVHEFHKATDQDVAKKGVDVAKCNYGDGMIKYGKYMSRVGISASRVFIGNEHTGFNFKFKKTVEKEVRLAIELMKMKKAGADAEKNGDPLGLPKQYVKAYEMLQTKTECGMLMNAFQAAKDAVQDLFETLDVFLFASMKDGCSR